MKGLIGSDIYIDKELKIIFISLNRKLTIESMRHEITKSIQGYEVVILECINNIEYLN